MQEKLTPERQNLIVEHLPLATSLANKVLNQIGLPPRLLDELIALANSGLTEAATRYDPARGIAFSTFSYYRIKGTIYDGLRDQGILGPRQKRKVVAEQRTSEYLEQAASSEPPRHPVGSSLEHTISEIGEHLANVAVVQRVSLDVETLKDTEAEEKSSTPLEERQEAERLRQALETLPARERTLIDAAYFGEKSLAEAGAELGLSRSWASRLHTRALKKLRRQLEDTS
jgi:RNA polymerase sigma factor for flagellar operon FliA